MTPEDLKAAQEAFQRYRGDRVVAITISYEDWMRETAVAWTRRTSTTQELDEKLRAYHNLGKTPAAYLALRQAFEKWVVAHPIWWQSDRNKKSARYPSGIIQELHDQIQLIGSYHYLGQMESGNWEGIQALRKAEKEAVRTLFQGRRLSYKNQLWKENVAAAVNQIALPSASIRSSIQQAKVDESGIRGGVHQILGGQDPGELFQSLGVGFDAFVHVMKNILNLALTPATLLKNIIMLGVQVSKRMMVKERRFTFAPGAADAALGGIISLIDRDLAATGADTGAEILKIVSGVCTGGLVAATGVVTTLVDLTVNMGCHEAMRKEMVGGNKLLGNIVATPHFNLELFDTSPLLGCYFIVMADMAVWMNYDAAYWGIDGFMDEQAKMFERAEPVREKARSFIRTSKIALSGTEYLGWEPTWKNNKMECLARAFGTRPDKLSGVDWVCGLLQKKSGDESKPPLIRQNASSNLKPPPPPPPLTRQNASPKLGRLGPLGPSAPPPLTRQNASADLDT